MKIVYKNLKGIISGQRFKMKNGRKVSAEDLGIIPGPVSILCDHGKIQEISTGNFANAQVKDCEGLVATAGLVDSHTHALFGGARWKDFFHRWAGKTYTEIAQAGGGIVQTFADTKTASNDSLLGQLRTHISLMHASGVRLLEIKSGYGESIEEEMRHLEMLRDFKTNLMEIKKTFLGLHAIPRNTSESQWTSTAISSLEKIRSENLAEFVDAFPEKGFFSISETQRFFTAAKKLGFGLKLHADEITNMEASALGIALGATSIDHLQKISEESIRELATSPTVATLLPATSFFLNIPYAPARKLLTAGARVALATDFNPGTAPEASPLFTARLAAAQMQMSPSEILCGLTFNGAGALACDASWGIIEKNYSDQILLWPCSSSTWAEEIILSGILPR